MRKQPNNSPKKPELSGLAVAPGGKVIVRDPAQTNSIYEALFRALGWHK